MSNMTDIVEDLEVEDSMMPKVIQVGKRPALVIEKDRKTNAELISERVDHVINIAEKIEKAVTTHPEDFEVVFAEAMRIAFPY